MSVIQILFLLTAVVTLGAAFLVVSARSLVHSALWLVLTLFGVGVLYVLLEAGFFAVAQVLIYIGAIAILFIFAVMLTRQIMSSKQARVNPNWWLAGLVAVIFFSGIVYMLSQTPIFNAIASETVNSDTNLRALGSALVSPTGYLLPFELASVLLVAAMVGAIYAALAKK